MPDHIFHRITLGHELPRDVGRHDPAEMSVCLRRLSDLFTETFGRRNLDYWFHQFPKVVTLADSDGAETSIAHRMLREELNAASRAQSNGSGGSHFSVGTRLVARRSPVASEALTARDGPSRLRSEDGLSGKRCEDCGRNCWRETETFELEQSAKEGSGYKPWLVFKDEAEIKRVLDPVALANMRRPRTPKASKKAPTKATHTRRK